MKDVIYTNEIGQFPHLSSNGNKYIPVAICIGSNYITMEPMKDRSEMQIITVNQKILDRLNVAGLSTQKHNLGNECSAEFN